MMCQEVIELMQRYLDKDLNDIEYNQLLGHLKQCPDCTELFQRLMSLSQELENLPKVTPAFSLVDAILPRLQHIEPPASLASDHLAAGLAVVDDSQATLLQNKNVTVTELAGWRSRMRGLVSAKIVGVVAAAGLLLGFFIFQQQQQGVMQNADGLIAPKAASSTAAGSSLKKDAAPTSSPDSGAANDTVPAAPSTGSSQQESQPAGDSKNKDLIPPSNVPIPQVNPASPGASKAPGRAGSSADSSLPTAPTSSTGSPQTPSSVVPQTPSGGFGNLQEPTTFGASSAQAAEPSTKAAPSGSVAPSAGAQGSAKTPAPAAAPTPAPEEAQPKVERVTPANPGMSGPVSPKSQTGDMGISALRVSQVKSSTSPDVAYKAVVNDKQQVVVSDKAGNTIFTGLSWTGSDTIDLIDWSSDNKQLNYQITNQSGVTLYVINLTNKTETKK